MFSCESRASRYFWIHKARFISQYQRWGTFLPLEAALKLGCYNFLYFTVGIFIYLSIYIYKYLSRSLNFNKQLHI